MYIKQVMCNIEPPLDGIFTQ